MLRKLIMLSLVVIGLSANLAQATSTKANYQTEAWNIISHTFPVSTAQKAYDVSMCETVKETDFKSSNKKYKARGMFQEIIQNDGRTMTWQGHGSLKMEYNRISSTRPDWYAAQVALYQSQGGTKWTEWDCG